MYSAVVSLSSDEHSIIYNLKKEKKSPKKRKKFISFLYRSPSSTTYSLSTYEYETEGEKERKKGSKIILRMFGSRERILLYRSNGMKFNQRERKNSL